jgi:hypothetical protein
MDNTAREKRLAELQIVNNIAKETQGKLNGACYQLGNGHRYAVTIRRVIERKTKEQ